MMRFGKLPRDRRGFAMILLAIAAASVCTVTVSTQTSGNGYQLQAVRQMMRNEQSRWLLESFNELSLARQCAPPWTGPGPEPQMFAQPYRFKPYMMGYTAGPVADTACPERIVVTLPSTYAMTTTQPSSLKIDVFNDPGMTKPSIQLELNQRALVLESAEAGAQREPRKFMQRRTSWRSRDGTVGGLVN